eukprot:scaffold10344_cov128-Cylindrotheca_fusiformis.AAC.4
MFKRYWIGGIMSRLRIQVTRTINSVQGYQHPTLGTSRMGFSLYYAESQITSMSPIHVMN